MSVLVEFELVVYAHEDVLLSPFGLLDFVSVFVWFVKLNVLLSLELCKSVLANQRDGFIFDRNFRQNGVFAFFKP